MAFEYGEQRDSSGNITHAGSWGTGSTPKEAFEKIIENFRVLKDEGASAEELVAALATAKLYTDGALAELVNSAPETLDTLFELSNALGNDPDFSSTVMNLIGTKATKATTLEGYGITDAASATHTHSFLNGFPENRSVATVPNDYNSSLRVLFKQNAVIGSPDASSYSSVLGFRAWVDSTGGNAHELAFTGNGNLCHRSGATTEWGAWRQLATTDSPVFTGKVGIGMTPDTTNPGVLQVKASANEGISIYGAGGYNGYLFGKGGHYGYLDYHVSSGDGGIRLSGLGPLRFGFNSNEIYGTSTFTEKMRLTSTGLGIGTTSPTVALDVVGAIKATEAIQGSITGNAATATNLVSTTIPSSADLNNYITPGMYRCPATVNAATVVNSPTAIAFALLVESHTAVGAKQTLTEYVVDRTPGMWYRNMYNNTWGAWKQIVTPDSPSFTGNITLGVNTTLRFPSNDLLIRSIESIGVLKLMGSETGGYAPRFEVTNGSGGVTTVLQGDTGNISKIGTRLQIGGITEPTTDNAYSLGTSSTRWQQLYAATATINTSDQNAKTDILDTTLGLNFINSLRPVEFKYKVRENVVTTEQDGTETVEIEPATYDDEGNILTEAVTEEQPIYKEVVTPLPGIRTHVGLIAQEVETALNGKDIGLLTKDYETGQYGLRYEEFIAPLVKAVQELSAKVDQITEKVGGI